MQIFPTRTMAIAVGVAVVIGLALIVVFEIPSNSQIASNSTINISSSQNSLGSLSQCQESVQSSLAQIHVNVTTAIALAENSSAFQNFTRGHSVRYTGWSYGYSNSPNCTLNDVTVGLNFAVDNSTLLLVSENTQLTRVLNVTSMGDLINSGPSG